MNMRHVLVVLTIIAMGVLYKRSVQTMQQGATPSDTLGEQITFITSDGQRFSFARDAAMKLELIRLTSKHEGHFKKEEAITLERISSQEFEALAPIINGLSTALNLDNLVIEKLKDQNTELIGQLCSVAFLLDEQFGHSVARLYIFKRLQADKNATSLDVAQGMQIDEQLIAGDYSMITQSVGLRVEPKRHTFTKRITIYLDGSLSSPCTNFYGLLLISQIGVMKEIQLVENKISYIPANTFDGCHQVEMIRLNHNGIQTIDKNAFNGLYFLRHLDLSENQIKELPVGIFSMLSALRSLNLSRNQIKILPAHIFDGLVGLQELFLSGNFLNLTVQEIKQRYFNQDSAVMIYYDYDQE